MEKRTKKIVESFLEGEITIGEQEELNRIFRNDEHGSREIRNQVAIDRALYVLMSDGSRNREVSRTVLNVVAESASSRRLKAGVLDEIQRISKEHKQAGKESASERVGVCSFRTQSEKRRSQRRKSAVPRIIWLSLAACLVIVAGAYFYNLHQMTTTGEALKAKLTEIHGKVLIERGDNEIRAQDNEELFSGDIIKTDISEDAKIKYDNEPTLISISDQTELNIHEEQGVKRVDIRKGKIECEVAPQPAGKRSKTR